MSMEISAQDLGIKGLEDRNEWTAVTWGVENARDILAEYDELTDRGDGGDALICLITDLKHYCDANGLDFYDNLRSAHAQYLKDKQTTPVAAVEGPTATISIREIVILDNEITVPYDPDDEGLNDEELFEKYSDQLIGEGFNTGDMCLCVEEREIDVKKNEPLVNPNPIPHHPV